MQILVKEIKTDEITPNITIGDECVHINSESDEYDFGYPDPIKCDYVDQWEKVLVCMGCKAFQIIGESEWRNE